MDEEPPQVLSYATPERRRRRELSTMYFAAVRVLIYGGFGMLVGWAAFRERVPDAFLIVVAVVLIWRAAAAVRVFVRGYED